MLRRAKLQKRVTSRPFWAWYHVPEFRYTTVEHLIPLLTGEIKKMSFPVKKNPSCKPNSWITDVQRIRLQQNILSLLI